MGVHEDERSADDSQRQHEGDERPCHPYHEGYRHCARCHQQADGAAPDQRSGRKYSLGKVSVGGLNHPRKYTTAPLTFAPPVPVGEPLVGALLVGLTPLMKRRHYSSGPAQG